MTWTAVFMVAVASMVMAVLGYHAPLQLNQIQGAGIHNGYHLPPVRPLPRWNMTAPTFADAMGPLRATHVELDVHLRNDGSTASGFAFDVYHIAGYDARSRCSDLESCLVHWLAARVASDLPEPDINHIQWATVILEPKGPLPWKLPALVELAQLLERVFGPHVLGRSALLAAAKPVGSAAQAPATLHDMATSGAWPQLHALAGKTLVLLMDPGSTMYMAYGDAVPDALVRLVDVAGKDEPDAAFIKVDDPVSPGIADLVKAGYMVRTRADAEYVPWLQTDDQILQAYVEVIDTNASGRVSTSEIRAFLAALDVVSPVLEANLDAAAAGCGDIGTGLDAAGLGCVRDALVAVDPSAASLIPTPAMLTPPLEAMEARQQQAIISGAHFVSTDYLFSRYVSPAPAYATKPDPYVVSFAAGPSGGYLCNPVTAQFEAPLSCSSSHANKAAAGTCPPNCATCANTDTCSVCKPGYTATGKYQDPSANTVACADSSQTTSAAASPASKSGASTTATIVLVAVAAGAVCIVTACVGYRLTPKHKYAAPSELRERELEAPLVANRPAPVLPSDYSTPSFSSFTDEPIGLPGGASGSDSEISDLPPAHCSSGSDLPEPRSASHDSADMELEDKPAHGWASDSDRDSPTFSSTGSVDMTAVQLATAAPDQATAPATLDPIPPLSEPPK
ncbi:uncharacterized protein AMSG_09399 [Thecamonas trahens ATCC 50062]|uniref:EF-hand domain-containing protein n=1 Tax=Thecamonas trahens ATCC 50062 TaxID=461836 RepID=A0A0L0DLC7_THETB|nr:hypothetical protein AMSG_09399 [Thecamonas trahens ATCC 50062]KNC53097.1 hypothetical protein AMSG_09399 [Thecamonas trahens ATCC 50062]|eukprot:XP_013754765.1 hypothetical protein AMSG_09399 [Thecamonas trahens ATCC 50062]